MDFSIFIGEKRKEREKKKMGRKIAFTSACMLLTASCTGLQTNLDKDSSANPVVANTSQNDEVKVIIKKGNDTKKNKKSKENNDEIKNKIAKKHSEKEEDDSDYITTNINSNGLLDEKELVDEEMPNSRLVMQKLTELKMEQRKILSEGTSSQKKVVALQNKLLRAYKQWKGTKYALGGDSASGIDCSAFTRRVYREVFSFELPRRSVDQAQAGNHVPRSQLKAGDIVFFKPEGTGNHTAVYLGNSLFLNASTSKGVVISTLENIYWNKTFKYGVRVNETA